MGMVLVISDIIQSFVTLVFTCLTKQEMMVKFFRKFSISHLLLQEHFRVVSSMFSTCKTFLLSRVH